MTISRRTALQLTFASVFGAAAPAGAASSQQFDPAAFEAAQKAGKSILVDVSAPWCPVCFVQGLTLRALLVKSRFEDLTVFHVDFDSQKPVLRRFNVQQQATLIVFKGAMEVGRSVGDPVATRMEDLLARSL